MHRVLLIACAVALLPCPGAGRMAGSADGRRAASTHGGSQDMALIDARTRAVVATIALGRGPGFPVSSPDGSVMNWGAGDVAVIDTATQKVVARHQVGINPFGGGLRQTASSSRQ